MINIQPTSPSTVGVDYQVPNPTNKPDFPHIGGDQTMQSEGFNPSVNMMNSEAIPEKSVLTEREATSLYMLFGGEQPAEQTFYGQSKAAPIGIGSFIDVAG